MAGTRGRKKGTAKSGGREKGTPNRPTKELAAHIAEKFPKFHAIGTLVAIADDDGSSTDQRIQAADKVAAYLFPKRKPIEAPVIFDLPVIKDEKDFPPAAGGVLAAVASGKLSIGDGERVMGMLVRALEVYRDKTGDDAPGYAYMLRVRHDKVDGE